MSWEKKQLAESIQTFFKDSCFLAEYSLNILLSTDLDDHGNTAFHLAIRCGNVRTIAGMFQILGNVRAYQLLLLPNLNGDTGFHLALKHDSLEILQTLIDLGGYIPFQLCGLENKVGKTILDLLIQREDVAKGLTMFRNGLYISFKQQIDSLFVKMTRFPGDFHPRMMTVISQILNLIEKNLTMMEQSLDHILGTGNDYDASDELEVDQESAVLPCSPYSPC